MTPNPKLTDGLPDWCEGSGRRPSGIPAGEGRGACFKCARVVKLTTQGHLRRHRVKVDEMVRQRRA